MMAPAAGRTDLEISATLCARDNQGDFEEGGCWGSEALHAAWSMLAPGLGRSESS